VGLSIYENIARPNPGHRRLRGKQQHPQNSTGLVAQRRPLRDVAERRGTKAAAAGQLPEPSPPPAGAAASRRFLRPSGDNRAGEGLSAAGRSWPRSPAIIPVGKAVSSVERAVKTLVCVEIRAAQPVSAPDPLVQPRERGRGQYRWQRAENGRGRATPRARSDRLTTSASAAGRIGCTQGCGWHTSRSRRSNAGRVPGAGSSQGSTTGSKAPQVAAGNVLRPRGISLQTCLHSYELRAEPHYSNHTDLQLFMCRHPTHPLARSARRPTVAARPAGPSCSALLASPRSTPPPQPSSRSQPLRSSAGRRRRRQAQIQRGQLSGDPGRRRGSRRRRQRISSNSTGKCAPVDTQPERSHRTPARASAQALTALA